MKFLTVFAVLIVAVVGTCIADTATLIVKDASDAIRCQGTVSRTVTVSGAIVATCLLQDAGAGLEAIGSGSFEDVGEVCEMLGDIVGDHVEANGVAVIKNKN